jgi:hypothetical protein
MILLRKNIAPRRARQEKTACAFKKISPAVSLKKEKSADFTVFKDACRVRPGSSPSPQ